MKKSKIGLTERAVERLGLPNQLASGVVQITITSNKSVFIENHEGIAEYGSEIMRINTSDFVLVLKGNDLELKGMNDRELLIAGSIAGLDLE